jgi:DeoR/GlpR family transcriptional regulator of sugar metabolism
MKMKRIQEEKKFFLSRKQATNIELCEIFGVSIETVRRDLNLLEEEGVIRKIYGGACIVENSQVPIPIDEWAVRMDKYPASKQSMAKEIARYIPDGSTVFLDSGTTVYHVACCLSGKKNVTVLTNSIRIVEKLGMNKDFQVYVIGGIIKTDILASSGVFATEFLANFYHIDYAVISCDGLIPDKGTTEHSLELSMLKKIVLEKTEKIIVMADHSKIGIAGSCLCCPIDRISIAVVDSETPETHINTMRMQGLEVVVAAPTGVLRTDSASDQKL